MYYQCLSSGPAVGTLAVVINYSQAKFGMISMSSE